MTPYAPASLDNTQPGYTLTRRINEGDAREFIPASDWKFAKCDATTRVSRHAGRRRRSASRAASTRRYFYELIYVAKDPKVMGLGLPRCET